MYLAVTVSKQNSEIESIRIFRKFLVLWVAETNKVHVDMMVLPFDFDWLQEMVSWVEVAT